MKKNTALKIGVVFIVGSIAFLGFGNSSGLFDVHKPKVIAKVNSREIPLTVFNSAYNEDLNRFQNILRTQLSDSQIRKFGIKDFVLNNLIDREVLFDFTDKSRLTVSDESVKKHTAKFENFQDADGNFSREKFLGLLSGAHISEAEYVDGIKKSLPVAMLFKSMFSLNPDAYAIIDKELAKKIYNYKYMSAKVNLLIIDGKEFISNIPSPTEEEFKALYNERKNSLRKPEYRSGGYIKITPDRFRAEAENSVTDQKISEAIDSLNVREQADLYNFPFPSEEVAKKALADIKAGVDFEEIAKKYMNQDLKSFLIKNVSRRSLPRKLSDIVFNLKSGEVSDLVKTSFGWNIVKVLDRHDISKEELDKIKEETRERIVFNKSLQLMNDFAEKINKVLKTGKTLKDVETEFNLKEETISEVSADAIRPTGEPYYFFNDNDNMPILMKLFDYESTYKPKFLLTGDAYISVFADKIIPSVESTFEESKKDLLDLWKSLKKATYIKQEVAKILENYMRGFHVEDTKGVKVEKDYSMYRVDVARHKNPSQKLSKEFVDATFTLKPGQKTEIFLDDSEDKAFVSILKSFEKPTEQEADVMAKGVAKAFSELNVQAAQIDFVKLLKSKSKISVNTKLLDTY